MVHACKADQHVHNCFDNRPRAEEHVNHIPISAADKRTKANKAPVQRSDDDEDAGEHTERGGTGHKKGGKE